MNIVVLTGAGVSAESGVPTFRAQDGLWENHRIDDVATPEAFVCNPKLVQQFYNDRRRALLQVQPNAAHVALATFAKRQRANGSGGDAAHAFLLVTQNIDDLHERAGSDDVVHMHGELLSAWCLHCGKKTRTQEEITTETKCLHCDVAGAVRPDIVWFGETPYEMQRIEDALAQCDLFVAVGTSGNVYPAAGFVATARRYGARCVELNLEPATNREMFDEGHYGCATAVVPKFFAQL